MLIILINQSQSMNIQVCNFKLTISSLIKNNLKNSKKFNNSNCKIFKK